MPSMTVKASSPGASLGSALLAVRVVTGSNIGIGRTYSSGSNSFPYESFTAEQNGSLVYGACSPHVTYLNGATWPLYAGYSAATTVLEQNAASGITPSFTMGVAFKAAGSTSAQTLGLSQPNGILSYTGISLALCEIISTSLAEDASTPATVPGRTTPTPTGPRSR
jgi:hypothetical protein